MNSVALHRVDDVNFIHIPDPVLEMNRALVESWWATHKDKRPSLFNGRIIACHSHKSTHALGLEIRWYESSYAHYLLRIEREQVVAPARAIYCSIALLTTEGRVVVGQMAKTTSSPDRLQLPGGNVEVADGIGLTLSRCAETACTELAEEVGLKMVPPELTLWRVKTGGDHDDVGLIFTNNVRLSEASINDTFVEHLAKLSQLGQQSELTHLHFFDSSTILNCHNCTWVDYLPAVMRDIAPVAVGNECRHE